MLNGNPAKQGVENRQRPRVEQRPFESWEQIRLLSDRIGPRHGPLVLFAAATGLRPSEWLALERRDIDREARIVYVRRAYRNGRLKCPKTDGSMRAVPLQAIALEAIDRLPVTTGSALLSLPRAAATSTCTTSATATGSLLSVRWESTQSAGFTISATPLPRSRSAPASPPSTSPATWAPA